jgi:hypothetical protein
VKAPNETRGTCMRSVDAAQWLHESYSTPPFFCRFEKKFSFRGVLGVYGIKLRTRATLRLPRRLLESARRFQRQVPGLQGSVPR